jgi:hypothetical protein
MVAQKRKAVAKGASELFKGVAAKASAEAENSDVDEEAASSAEEEEELSVDELAKQQEKDTNEARRKELKAMYVDELKDIASKQGITVTKRDEIIDAVVKSDAKERQAVRDHESRIRSILEDKKKGLEDLSYSDLCARCNSAGIVGKLAKDACVAQLLKVWLEAGGVLETIAQMERDKRKCELDVLEKKKLRTLSEKAGLDPFVKEVMVERIVKRESAAGRFARPVLPKSEVEAACEETTKPMQKKDDVIAALLASDASRKKEDEAKQQEMDRTASKLKELSSLSVDDIKKRLAKKGLKEATGKKDELVTTLLKINLQEEADTARRAKLLALSLPDSKTLIESNGLQISGKKEQMVDAFFAHDANIRKQIDAYEAKCREVEAQKRAALEDKSAGELKELCADKGLKLGASNEDRVDRLLESARQDGELDAGVAVMVREARKGELLAWDKPALLKLCDQTGADPLVKEIMVERILSHEKGDAEDEGDAPVAKKARK